jgi:hypothetical protein
VTVIDTEPGTALERHVSTAPEEYRPRIVMAPEDAKALDDQLRSCMLAVLRENVDYGLIPGAGDKKNLLKPGAEKLLQWFGFGSRSVEVKTERDDPEHPSGIADKAHRIGISYRTEVTKTLADGREVIVATCEGYAGFDEDRFFQTGEDAQAKARAKEEKWARIDKRSPNPNKWQYVTDDYRAPWNTIVKMCLAASTPLLVKSPQGEYLTEATRLHSWLAKPSAPTVHVPGPDGEWVPVTGMFRNGVQPVLRITLRDGTEHRVTAAHRFLTPRGLVAAGDLVIGDTLTRRTIPLAGMKEPDPDFGWLVGLSLADGHISKWGVKITLGIDEEQLAHRAVWIGRRLGCPAHYEQRTGMKAWLVTITGPAITGLLSQFLTGKGSYGKHLRATAWRSGSEFLDGVLRGWLDGDGSWTERPGRLGYWRVAFTGHNDMWLRDLRVLGAILGYRVNVRTGTSKAGGKTFGTFVGDVKVPASTHGNNADPAQVMSVEPDGETMTYDLEVGTEDHLYLLHDGTVTHNSQKRSYVGAAIDATSAAGLFTQDMEDHAPAAYAVADAGRTAIEALPGATQQAVNSWWQGQGWPPPERWDASQWCLALIQAGRLSNGSQPDAQPTAPEPAAAPQAAGDGEDPYYVRPAPTRVEADPEWLAVMLRRAAEFGSWDDDGSGSDYGKKVWKDTGAVLRDRKCAKDEADQIAAVIKARVEELKAQAAAEPVVDGVVVEPLDPEDDWAVKIGDISDKDDLAAADEERIAAAAAGTIGEEYSDRIRVAILKRAAALDSQARAA